MAQRKEVFQSKVLQKLYPPPKPVKTRSPPHSESLAKKSHVVKRKTPGEDALHGRDPSAANQGRRMYTALPPPPDYHIQSQESVTLPQLHGVNTAEDPAEEKVQEHSEDSDEETEEEEEPRKRRRRKKKRRPSPGPDCGKDGEASGSRAPADEGGEPMSRNKKRKLKKKRHKEKLLSMGLIPRAAAVEFTYQRDEEETEDEERKAAEVSEFLRTTMETYVSDCRIFSRCFQHSPPFLLSLITCSRGPSAVCHSGQACGEAVLRRPARLRPQTAAQPQGVGPALRGRQVGKGTGGTQQHVCFISRGNRCRRFTLPILDHRHCSHAERREHQAFYNTPMRLSATQTKTLQEDSLKFWKCSSLVRLFDTLPVNLSNILYY
ncbi:uncharacterized protein erich1 isoform X2 [Salarias fasciatus]|uniref:uncharacterized protein erich1 isoform X2 n=1 Tax=Salarias fasciatus TaxID=181472 RepID=UPI0011770D86|nr:glutamate-rich protein 1 isoform X2 [Salarias fasciatus]